MLTTFALEEYVFDTLRAGASGFLLKDAPPQELLRAIHVVDRGDALLDPAITRTVIAEFARAPVTRRDLVSKLELLTEREREVFELVARGHSNSEIARRLFVGEGTVKTHVGHILSKLDARDRVQVVICAYESGAIEAGATPG